MAEQRAGRKASPESCRRLATLLLRPVTLPCPRRSGREPNPNTKPCASTSGSPGNSARSSKRRHGTGRSTYEPSSACCGVRMIGTTVHYSRESTWIGLSSAATPLEAAERSALRALIGKLRGYAMEGRTSSKMRRRSHSSRCRRVRQAPATCSTPASAMRSIHGSTSRSTGAVYHGGG